MLILRIYSRCRLSTTKKCIDSARYLSSGTRLQAKAGATPKLPTSPARTRFAPSPTGQLHLGSLRTALFNYLLARKTGGQFLLRLEDTDARRTVPGAEESLYSDLRWAGLQWDEGPEIGGQYGPYRQSERTAIYRQHTADLLKTEHAYRCFCGAERLDALARQRRELGMPTDYDRTCAHIPSNEAEERAASGERHVVRLRAPDFYPAFTDVVYGRIGGADTKGVTMKHGEIAYEDPILLKSDGTPTYHLANVIDDHLMQITHVVRATEWLPSTPKHLALYRAFGWQPPAYMHVGLLVDSEGRKLSKRTMSTGVGAIRDEMHVLAPALVNFAALLGWSHDKRSDVMQLDQLVDAFQAHFTKGNVTVALEKLWFMQKAHAALTVQNSLEGKDAAQRDLDKMLGALVQSVKASFPEDQRPSTRHGIPMPLTEYIKSILVHDARNYRDPDSFVARNRYFFCATREAPLDMNAHGPIEIRSLDDIKCSQDLSSMVERTIMQMQQHEWTHDKLEAAMKQETHKLAESRKDQDMELLTKSESQARLGEMLRETTARVKDGPDADEQQLKARQKLYYRLLCKYLRLALLNGSDGPGLGWTMEILGQDICMERMEHCARQFDDYLRLEEQRLLQAQGN